MGGEDAKKDGKPAADVKATKDGKGKEKAAASKPKPRVLTPLEVLMRNVVLLDKFVESHDARFLTRALRFTAHTRTHVPLSAVRSVAEHYITAPGRRAVLSELFDAVARVRKEPTVASTEVDMAAEPAAAAAPAASTTPIRPRLASSPIAELDAYVHIWCLGVLVSARAWTDVYRSAATAVDYFEAQNRRTLDVFCARLYTYIALAHEKLRLDPDALLTVLANAHRAAVLRHDNFGSATLLNLCLRTHLNSNSFDAAAKLIAKATFPEAASNAQFVRYLYYQGRIQAVQLAYSDAHASLTQAIRKAPPSATGFLVRATQLSVLVQLLMGDIPERSTFTAKDSRVPLAPYMEITRAVRNGDLAAFNAVLVKHTDVLARDGTLTLANRLAANVIKAGLRSIALAYSRITFAHIAAKLSLASAVDAEFLAAKAIRDGVIDAQLQHDEGVMVSREVTDVYSTKEPQEAFHRRITFCLDVHNEAIKSMRYPPHANREDLETAEKRAAREAEEADIVKEIEEGGFDDDDE